MSGCNIKKRLFPRMVFPALLVVLLILWIQSENAASDQGQGENKKFVPASLLKWPGKSSGYAVLVDKSAQKVFLYHKNDLFNPVKIYPCSTGENNGAKAEREDKKTPEGIYFFTSSHGKRELSPIYGVRALPMDYPNPLDKIEGKGGYGIWFHGTNRPLKPYDSNGCIVMANHDIENLAGYIQIDDTPVIISMEIRKVSPERLKQETRELERILEHWGKAWENKEIERYLSFYSSQVSSEAMGWQGWKKDDEHLAKRYGEIEVEINNIGLFRNGHMVLAVFDQTYTTSTFQSHGLKRLYFKQNSEEWKIFAEVFQEDRQKRISELKINTGDEDEIRRLIHIWREAWEAKDLNRYLSCYDSNFTSRGMDLEAWEKHRDRLNKRYNTLKIRVDDIDLKKHSKQSVTAQFKQTYLADEYYDYGLKKLTFIKKDGFWKIKKETWRPLRGKPRS
jgi:murein L,D-transpeptidase YafK